jgi:RND family efflux transporter MFP subunit
MSGFLLLLPFLSACAQEPVATAVADAAIDLRPRVRSHTVARQPFSDSIELNASLYAVESAILVPKSAGRVERVHVRIGDAVKAGSVLLEIDDSDYLQGQKEAEAAKALADVQARQANSALKRLEALHAKGAVTDAQLEDAQAGKELADAQSKRAEAGLQVAENRLSDTRLRAPFDGVVIARNVQRGELMGGPVQQPPIMLADLSQIRAIASISESQLSQIKEGMALEVHVPALGQKRFEAIIERINHAVDPVVRTIQFESVIENPDLSLKHGMSAEIVLTVNAADHPGVPRSALLDRGGSQARVLLLEGGTVVSRQVGYGRSSSEMIPVLSGLKPGEQVLVAGHTRLSDGEEVVDVASGGQEGK